MTTASGLRRPPGRYDERSPLPPALRYGGTVLLLVALAAFAWFGYDRYSSNRVSYVQLDTRVVSDTETTVTFELRKSSGTRVQCSLNAVDAGHNEVGSGTVLVDAGVQGTTRVTGHVRTSRRAAVGQVLTCRVLP